MMFVNFARRNLNSWNKWNSGFIQRCISTTQTRATMNSVLIEADIERFDATFPYVIKCITSNSDKRLRPALEHSQAVLEYNVPHGKKQRGLLTVATYKMLTAKQSKEQLFLASVMGWCVELLQASFLVSDDIADNSKTRRGQPCWYLQKGIGLHFAVNDVMVLENGLYQLLQSYFRKEAYYINVVDLFRSITVDTTNGQIMDVHFAKSNLDGCQFTLDNYDAICHYKTSLYSYYLPVALAMYMAGIKDDEIFNNTKQILLKVGNLFQIQDDYLDCFGDPSKTGKVGTDIEEGKCTWFIVNALKLVSEEEAILLKSWYGKQDPSMVKLVHNKYAELKLDQLYAEYEKKTYDAIMSSINDLPPSIPQSVFHYCLQALYKRKK